jgi:hypothetical protein
MGASLQVDGEFAIVRFPALGKWHTVKEPSLGGGMNPWRYSILRRSCIAVRHGVGSIGG